MPQIVEGSEQFFSGGTALVTRKSLFTGKTASITIRATEKDFRRWRSGWLIQDAFPLLTADEREFLLTGATPEEWGQEYGSDPDA